MEFTQSILAHDEPVVAGSVVPYDLPVNPLSHVLITLKFKRTAAAAAGVPAFVNVLKLMDKIEVLYKGSAVFSMSGADCVASGIFVPQFESWGINYSGIAGEECSFTFLVPMTRVLYSPRECFPRTTRGELTLQITYEAVLTGMTTVKAQIETVELPGATPEQFIKQTTKAATPAATGQYDVELPIGNDISELVLFGTTYPEGAADTATLNLLEILVDNINHFYPESNFETIHNMAGRMRAAPGYWGYHIHGGTYTTVVYGLSEPVIASDHILKQYLHMPFDIFGNGEYALHTAGASDVVLRLDIGIANALRVIPVEVVKGAGAV